MYEIAQLNIAAMKASLDAPSMAEFAGNIDRLNRMAEQSPGYVWRLGSDDGDDAGYRPLGDRTLVNLSVWTDIDSLSNYVYRSVHVEIMRRRREWFDRMGDTHMVLWWVPAGHRPTLDEALERLELLRANGPSPDAFTFSHAYGSPDSAGDFSPFGGFDDACPA